MPNGVGGVEPNKNSPSGDQTAIVDRGEASPTSGRECRNAQSRIACKLEWTLLVPLPRTHPLYTDLHEAHFETGERFFANFCGRYFVFGDDKSSRLKRFRSLEAQRLRAQTARFLEWFRISLRFGWLAGHKTVKQAELRAKNGIGSNSHQGLLFNRRKRRLDCPTVRPRSAASSPARARRQRCRPRGRRSRPRAQRRYRRSAPRSRSSRSASARPAARRTTKGPSARARGPCFAATAPRRRSRENLRDDVIDAPMRPGGFEPPTNGLEVRRSVH